MPTDKDLSTLLSRTFKDATADVRAPEDLGVLVRSRLRTRRRHQAAAGGALVASAACAAALLGLPGGAPAHTVAGGPRVSVQSSNGGLRLTGFESPAGRDAVAGLPCVSLPEATPKNGQPHMPGIRISRNDDDGTPCTTLDLSESRLIPIPSDATQVQTAVGPVYLSPPDGDARSGYFTNEVNQPSSQPLVGKLTVSASVDDELMIKLLTQQRLIQVQQPNPGLSAEPTG